jgi:hypothetical protein
MRQHPLSSLHIPRGPSVTFHAIPFPIPEASAAVLKYLGGECLRLNREIAGCANDDRKRCLAAQQRESTVDALEVCLAAIRSSYGVEFTRPSYSRLALW